MKPYNRIFNGLDVKSAQDELLKNSNFIAVPYLYIQKANIVNQ